MEDVWVGQAEGLQVLRQFGVGCVGMDGLKLCSEIEVGVHCFVW